MFERELEIVLANLELVRPVTTEKIRDGIVRTPVMSLESREGRDRIKICMSEETGKGDIPGRP